MLFKLSVLVALVAPLVSALQVSQPNQAVTSGGSMTFTWTVQSGDPSTFSVFLSNPQFNNVYGVANNVDASTGSLTIAVPLVPENQQYTIRLVPIDNVNQVLAESPSFTIGASTSTTASTTAAVTTTSATTRSGATTSVAAPTTTRTSSSSAFGVTISNTRSATTATSPSGSNTGAPATTTSNSAALPVRFDMNMGVLASMVLSVVAGAAVVAL